MSASFLISLDSIEFFSLPQSFLKKEGISACSLDTARIKMTLVAGLRRRETFKSNPIPVSSLPLRGFGSSSSSGNNNDESNFQPSKVIRLTRDSAISHRFAEITFTRVQEQQTQSSAASSSSVAATHQQISFQTSKVIEFELRLYGKNGTERRVTLVSTNSFPLQKAINPGSFPEGIISPKVYFRLSDEEYDGAAVAVLTGNWRRLHVGFDAASWVNNNNSNSDAASNNNLVASASKSDMNDNRESDEQNKRQVTTNNNNSDFGANKQEDSMMYDAMGKQSLSWGDPTSRNFLSGGDAASSAMASNNTIIRSNNNNNNIKNRPRKLVVITGGARGIGSTLVKMFLLSGFLVSTCDLLEFDEEELEHVKAEALKRHHGIPNYFSSSSSSSSTTKKKKKKKEEDKEMTLEEKQRKVLKMEQDEAQQDNTEPFLARSKSEKVNDYESDDGEKEEDRRSKILFTYRCNITNEEAVQKFVSSTASYFPEETSWLSVICNAAIANPYMATTGVDENDQNGAASDSSSSSSSALSNIDITAFKNFLNVNITGSLIVMKYCAKYLEPRKNPLSDDAKDFNDEDPEHFGGSIILISSTRAVMSEANSEGYAASKGGIESLCHSVAISNPRIRCNAIRVGWVNATPGYEPSFGDHSFHPCGRVGRTADVFQMCRFLSQNELSGFVTGSVMTLDGGVTKKMIYPEE